MKEEVLERKADGNGNLAKVAKGLEFRRYFSREGVSPYDAVEWEYRTAAITSESGDVIFEQKNVEVPKTWSMTATNIVASKYFHGKRGTPERESSVRQLVGRVATTIADGAGRAAISPPNRTPRFFRMNWFICFESDDGVQLARSGSTAALKSSPSARPASSTRSRTPMGSILDLAKTEGMLFKWGSGAGSNLSPIRSSKENCRAVGSLLARCRS